MSNDSMIHSVPASAAQSTFPADGSTRQRPSLGRIGFRLAAAATALAGAVVLAGAVPAAASTTATATITGGTLNVVVPSTLAFSDTLNGQDQVATSPLPIDVQDTTGSGLGWNLTATSTQFTTGTNSLSTSATTVQSAPSDACDGGVSCSLAGNSIAYPYSLPAGSGPPAATQFFDAAAASGLGDQTVTPTFTLAIPANTYAGSYTSTWTVSVVSGP